MARSDPESNELKPWMSGQKPRVKDTNPDGIYSGMAVRNAINDEEWFPGQPAEQIKANRKK